MAIKRFCKKKKKNQESLIQQQPSLYEFNMSNSGHWSKQILNQKSLLHMYHSIRHNPI